MMTRFGVQGSIEGCEKLFQGARRDTGSSSKPDSIDTRAKEYKTMVYSFYDLVTDFYEWGWGQVRDTKSRPRRSVLILY
jgi:sterol 24-C-methyltransferase